MSEFHSRPVYDWNNENWTTKCPYCDMACYPNSKGQKKMKLFDIQFFETDPFSVNVLMEFFTPTHRPKCGRDLTKME